MLARRTFLRGSRSLEDIAAVPAMPLDGFSLFKDFATVDIVQQLPVSRFVEFLYLGDLVKGVGDLREPLVAGDFGKIGIKSRPFEILSRGGRLQVRRCIADDAGRIAGRDFYVAAFQIFEENLGMLLLIFRGFQKERGDLLKAFFFSLACKIGISVSRLGFPGRMPPAGFSRF